MGAAGVLVDVDGTLVDSNYLHTLAWQQALREGGYEVPARNIHRLIGMGSDQLLKRLTGFESPELSASSSRVFAEMKPQLRALPRAAEALRVMSGRGLRVVLATSAQPQDMADLRRTIDADDAIAHVVGAADVSESKPSPQIFLTAIRQADLDPGRTMVIGDTVWDVMAATAAGVPCTCVLTGGIGRDELMDAGAVQVYDDLGDLLDNLGSGPLAPLLADAQA
jgi:HAD superfamily hydrolase (TIGR01549 family)